jgi:hypothetical protein
MCHTEPRRAPHDEQIKGIGPPFRLMEDETPPG